MRILLTIFCLIMALSGRAAEGGLIVCWGDSLSTDSLYPQRLRAAFPGREVYAQAVGSEGADQILGRMFGQQLLKPRIEGEGAHRVVHLHTTRHIIPRLNSERYRKVWPQALTRLYDPVESVEFRLRDTVLGIVTAPVATAASTDVARSATRIYAPGHGLAEYDIVWFASDKTLPGAIETARSFRDKHYPSRHYYVRNPQPDSFEVAEFTHWHPDKRSEQPILELGMDADGPFRVISGYALDWRPGDRDFSPEGFNIRPVFARNRATHILWMGANNLSQYEVDKYKSPSAPRIQRAIAQAWDYLSGFSDRILVLTVLNGSYPDRGPGSDAYRDALDTNRWIRETYPENCLDIVALLHAERRPDEPEEPQLRAMHDADGKPIVDGHGQPRMAWVGPGFTPLQFRPPGDRIHLNDIGNDRVGAAVAAELRRRGW